MPNDRENKTLLAMANMTVADRNQAIMNATVSGLAQEILGGIDTDKVSVKVHHAEVVSKNDNNDKKLQQQVRNQNGTWADELRADVDLIDKETGKVVDSANIKLADVPKLTDRNTYVIGGNEYGFTTQARLRPGVYTKTQNNGEVSSFFNVDKTIDFDRGFNNNFKITFEPEAKTFWLQYGQKNIPLITALRALGKSDGDIRKELGDEVYQANSQRYDKSFDKDLNKFHLAVFGKAPTAGTNSTQIGQAIKDRLYGTKLDPETTALTLGRPYEHVDGQVISDAVKKIIAVHKGEKPGDERDSLIFKSFIGPEDIVRESLVKNARNIRSNIGYRLGKTMSIRKSVSSQTMSPFISGVIVTSKLSNPPSQVNVMSALGDGSKVTIMGEGGIGSTNAISDEARQISNTEMGFMDPLHTPEGGGIGVVNHLSNGTVRVGHDIYTAFKNVRSQKHEMMRPIDAYDKIVAFPDEYAKDKNGNHVAAKDKVRAVHRGQLVEVDKSKVDFVIPKAKHMFDFAANAIPFLSSIQGNRGLTASKMQEQAVPLVHRDEPLFKIVDEDGQDIHKDYGQHIGIPKSPTSGEVVSVTPDNVRIKDDKGGLHNVGLYNHFSLNNESFLHNTATVKPGQKVSVGQVLADSNNTKNGRLSLGTNLRVAYMPLRGYNYEDSTIVSESAAKKLTSEHIYDFKARRSSSGEFNRDKYKAYYPEAGDQKVFDKLDANGVVKVGTEVEHGDLLIAHLEKKSPTADDLAMKRLDKQSSRDMANHGVHWESGHKGVVTSVEQKGKDVVVSIKTAEQLKVGDKLSGLHGNKHIVSVIVPDHDMPFNPKTGEHIEMTMSPIGVVNRINTSQILENAAGKLAMKTGKPYEIGQFDTADNTRKLMAEMKLHGVEHKDVLVDPLTGKEIKTAIANGVSHVLKLEHKVDHKFSARYREGHDSNEQAVSGGETGGKNLGRMEVAALLARGAYSNLDEMFNIKGQRNDAFWKAVETGQTPPPPKDSFVWHKFEAMLRGAGVNTTRNGSMLSIAPLNDADIDKLSNGRLDNAVDTYRKKDLAPIRGGLFDPVKAGGIQGAKYTHFDLPEPILNPAMEDATASILGMTGAQLQDVIRGKQFVSESGELVPPGTAGSTSGGPGLKVMLDKIDPKTDLSLAKESASKTKDTTKMNKLNRKAHYLQSMIEQGHKPSDYLISKVLVIPSKYRPMFSMGADNTVIMSDVNYLYQQAASTAKAFTDYKKTLDTAYHGHNDFVNASLADTRGALYDDVKAITGFGEPTSFLHRQKGRKGFMSLIDGGDKQTKEGFFQDRVMERRQDLVGRSTLTLNPDLGADEIGVPKAMATKMFQPFIMKRLVEWGYSPLEAKRQIDEGTSVFQKARDVVASERIVIANRAPTLHRYNMVGFKPVLTEGKTLEVPSIVVSRNFGGDFDGDTFQLHTPIGAKALEEARKMMPSQNAMKHGYDTAMNAPDQDILAGAWIASKGEKGEDRSKEKIESEKDLEDNLRRGKIDDADTVTLNGVKATAGMHVINSILPHESRDYTKVLSKSNVESWLSDIAKKHGDSVSVGLADKMKEVGNRAITSHGMTLGIEDTASEKELRDEALSKVKGKVFATAHEMAHAYNEVKNELMQKVQAKLGDKSSFGIGLASGSSKKIDQVININGMPGVVMDASGKPIAIPVTESYSEGLSGFGYWAAAHGARSGNIQKSVSSWKPGAMTKSLINSIYQTKIDSDKPMDAEGMEMSVDNARLVRNRYLARPIISNGVVIAKANEHITSDIMNAAKKAGVTKVFVQSPLTDPTPGDAFSSYSYGTDHKGLRPKSGTDIGIISAHTITEPSLNMAMKAFHTGGVFSGKKAGTAFDVMDKALKFTHIPDKAAVASENGVIEAIHKSSVGGYDVTVKYENGSSETLYSHPHNALSIRVGDKVDKGAALDKGEVDIHDILRTKGMRAAQLHLVKTLSDVNEGRLDSRDIETLVRGITNTTRVMKDDGGRYIPGDVAPLTAVEFHNNHREADIAPTKAIGWKLGSKVRGFESGTIIDESVAKTLENHGIATVNAMAPMIHHEPFLVAMGIESKASTAKDFVARMAHTRIRDVVSQGAAQGWQSDLSGKTHPIPMLVAGGHQRDR